MKYKKGDRVRIIVDQSDPILKRRVGTVVSTYNDLVSVKFGKNCYNWSGQTYIFLEGEVVPAIKICLNGILLSFVLLLCGCSDEKYKVEMHYPTDPKETQLRIDEAKVILLAAQNKLIIANHEVRLWKCEKEHTSNTVKRLTGLTEHGACSEKSFDEAILDRDRATVRLDIAKTRAIELQKEIELANIRIRLAEIGSWSR